MQQGGCRCCLLVFIGNYFSFQEMESHIGTRINTDDTDFLNILFKITLLSGLLDQYKESHLEHGFYADREALLEELNHLVRNNYLYYNTTLAEYKLQGKSMEIGLNRFLREISA